MHAMASQPTIIVLMGPTGSGKSNFINRLTQGSEDGAARGPRPHMQTVMEYTVNLSNNRQYVFVDTPGFDVTYQSVQDILRTTADWLKKK
ncbi:hypothetical protein EDC04DRAFT_2776836 [Pisolithus marmoratus]|nr:hypothetical protein EDC04DRAFT_2776836 [Pisolithus marmoratus]